MASSQNALLPKRPPLYQVNTTLTYTASLTVFSGPTHSIVRISELRMHAFSHMNITCISLMHTVINRGSVICKHTMDSFKTFSGAEAVLAGEGRFDW